MATVQQGLQAQIRNIEATYGKPMSEWVAIISASGLTKHIDVVAMLKKDYGMTHGAAHRVSLVARVWCSPLAHMPATVGVPLRECTGEPSVLTCPGDRPSRCGVR